MLNLNHFKGKDIQNFITIINSCEKEGVTDIRFVRTKLQEYVNEVMVGNRLKKRKTIHTQKKAYIHDEKVVVLETCPSCGKGLLTPWLNKEGLNIFGCKKCRYSKIMEDKDVNE